MLRTFLPVAALLLGSGLLFFAGGIHGLILPLRGGVEGFTAGQLGLLGTGWAIGYISGCLFAPGLVAKVGHIRVFGVMCAVAAISVLLQSLIVSPWPWIVVRGVAGFCFAGAAMIVESWLSDRATPQSRGRIFGVYSMVNLLAMTGGQLAISLGDVSAFTFFAIAAIVYATALIPTALSTSQAPPPLTVVRLDIKALYRNSPVAVVGVCLIGVTNGAFGTLAAVYADRIGLTVATITLFASLPVLAGAAAQLPVGLASDRMDRRKVLAATVVVAIAASALFVLWGPGGRVANLVLVAVFGAAIFAMYPVIVAHANDHAPPGTAIQVSGGLLLTYGAGSIVGPLAAGFAMAALGAWALFATILTAHLLMLAYTLWRLTRRPAVIAEAKGTFQPTAPTRNETPGTIALAKGEDEAAPLPPATGSAAP
ncbi:MAG: MFS transporter [Shimia sp.]